jgi:decaprenyl-phosphate phosphoribosyltransferase
VIGSLATLTRQTNTVTAEARHPSVPTGTPSLVAADVATARSLDASEPTPEPNGTSANLGVGLVRLARPHQWIKNLLVFVAPAAGGVLLHWNALWHASAAFGIFCLAASGIYYLNDAMDAQADRRHPKKRFRPVASGVVPVGLALAIGSIFLAVAICLAGWLAGYDLMVVMALYAAVNIGYSLGFKNEPILDLALVSAGFVLRAIAGGVATGVPLSDWFIIVASFGSLLVVTGKRLGEKKVLEGVQVDQHSVRKTLGLYSSEFLRTVLTLSVAVTVTAYCLWAFERASQVHSAHHPIWFQLSIIPFVLAVLHIVRLLDSGKGAAPEDLAIHDHRLQIYGLIWIAIFAVATYA